MLKKPIYLDELIDRASKAAGNDSQLAKRLKVNRQAVSNWRHSNCPCPPADVALMAEIAGLDAEAWTARAVIAQHEGTEKGEALKEALKKALQATGAAMLICGQAQAAIVSGVSDFIRCIFSKALSKA